MKGNLKEFDREKRLFKTVYCLECKQVKVCRKLDTEICCSCAYQIEKEKAQEYSNYQQVYQRKEQEQKEHIQQLKLLREYSGCKNCQSKEVDAYSLYEKNQLACQPCRMKKEGSATGAISFVKQSK